MYASLNGAESNLNNLDKVEYLNNNTDNDYNSNSEDKNYTNTSNNNDNNSDNRSSDINNNFNLNCLSITWLLCVIWGFFWVFDFYSSSHLLISFDISPIHLKTALTVPFLSLKNFFQLVRTRYRSWQNEYTDCPVYTYESSLLEGLRALTV